MQNHQIPQFLDGFCGAGGASLGIERAGCEVAVAINHDERAIWAHHANHPTTLHLNTDIREVNIHDLAQKLLLNGIGRICIWWSAECTHFSNAKGGASRDADSRMLSEELLRYIKQLEESGISVDFVFVENVREFFSWCPLLPKRKFASKGNNSLEKRYSRIQIEMFDAVANGDNALHDRLAMELDAINERFLASGQYIVTDSQLTMLPDPKTKGMLYLRWHERIESMGYGYQFKMLNSADFGAYQSRERYFGVFVKKSLGIDIKWPKATHSKTPKAGSLFESGLQPWKPCREILDLEDKGESIFYGRKGKKPLVAATLARIEYGMNKFRSDAILVDRSNTGASPTSSESPLPTVRASFKNSIVTIDNYTHGSLPVSADSSLPTVMAKRDKYLMTAYIVPSNYANPPYLPDQPFSTILASRKHQYLCNASFITPQFGQSMAIGIDGPVGTIMVHDKNVLIQPFIAQQYGSSNAIPCNVPLWAITTSNHQSLITPFVCKYYGSGDNATSIETPLGTATTKDRFAMMQCRFIQYTYGGHNSIAHSTGTDAPINTIGTGFTPQAILITAIDTDSPLILRSKPEFATTKRGNLIWPSFGKTRIVGDYEASWEIQDIHYRMLKVSELKLAQGFPSDYILDPHSDTIAKKHIGNAVQVDVAHHLVAANCGPESQYSRLINTQHILGEQIA